ncbi:COG4 transport protein-domain-containing protein [Cantharellus anzutake]|uniref:COG4 transport protein-domain-containing protein n=1 Tax=Cantharellus anzutake TaxID=1750568 RepID=UPI001904B739|nr:COG4 transport protein-domain-containing protein [Cantharellus anzutake]KAF8309865.1 COG4 transport protein-domain-containing protein [Cantharellus anzutake]
MEAELATGGSRLVARELRTLPELLSALSRIQSEESALSSGLSALLEAREPLKMSLARLSSLKPQIHGLRVEAVNVSEKVGVTAKTAERVRGKVQALDEEMRRIREALERVGLVLDLKSSLDYLRSAMESRDWESASRHCSRAMSIPEDIICGRFTDATVPSAESHLPPIETLSEARNYLLHTFRDNFERAVAARDSAGITRFFKLFPTIGWEKEGLAAYSDFVVDLVRSRPISSGKTSSPMHYVSSLTSLFESIAIIVSQHQPVVEKYYGDSKMRSVIERLLGESDRAVVGLVENWEEDRQARRKLQDTMNIHFPSLVTGAQRRQVAATIEVESADPREIDQFLSELSGMVGRWSLFHHFLYERLKDTEAQSPSDKNGSRSSVTSSDILTVLQATKSASIFDKIVSTYYLPLESWYLRAIIDKSHRLSAIDSSATPPQNTTPDDVFYVLKAVLTRMISLGTLSHLKDLLLMVKATLERDYSAIIKTKMDEVYTSKPGSTSVKTEKAEKENRIAFMILLNDLSISTSHTETLVRNLISSTLITQSYLDIEVETAQKTVSSLLGITGTFKSVLHAGIEQLFNQLIRPKLRQFVADIYKDVSYNLDQDAHTAAEYNDVVRKRFARLWGALLDGFQDTLTGGNYHQFFLLTVEVLTRHWEKQILTMRFSELGALRFDRDLRSVSGYLSTLAEFGDGREKFQRLQQISTILNLDEEEDADEFYSGSGIVWRLSANDVKTIVGLRT